MEILRRQLDLLRSRLSPDDARAVSDEALAAIPDVYPFNPCEYYAARLIDRGVLSFGQYEALRADYLRRNVNLPLYTLAPRTFGQTWGEPYVRSLLPGALRPSRDLDPGYSGQYDLWLPGGPRPLRIEVKAARVAVARPGGTLVSKALQKATCGRVPFDLNFQQLKPGCCDAFVWLGVWADTIDHWVLSPDDVRSYVPYGASWSIRKKIARAMSCVKVRRPIWSSTTVTCSNASSGFATRSDSAIIVFTKLWPSPITQLERRM